ncbi:hypothetical protein RhiLY_04530 [Ceratobasidium sp. AG-Ba]|nr:hypothetical protein RhiLY_04530 [Ceratobasidium sp. AG-Ba]
MGRHPNRAATEDDFEFDPPVAQSGQPKTTKLHCPFCTLSWTKQVDYNRHLVTHKHTKPYACKHKGCRKSFSQKTALITHWNTHTGARPHRCRHPGCSSAFGDPSSRTRHEKETHNPANGYKCRKCDHVSKRREQFRRHYKDCFKKDAIEDHFVDAREYCASAYAELVTKGEVSEEELPPLPPLKRKRRGAITAIPPSTPPEEYEEEDDEIGRPNPPKYEPSYTGDFSSESAVTSSPKFYRASEEPADKSLYEDAFKPVYTSLPAAKYYSQPPPQYTPHDLSSPGRRFDYSLNLSRMSSPTYDAHDMNGRMIGSSYGPGCLPTGDSPFSTIHSTSGHTGNYSISTPHISSSPHFNRSPHAIVSTPPLLMPVATRQTVLFDHVHDSPLLNLSQPGYGTFDVADRVPRGGQSRLHLEQHRYHPYAHDRHGGPSTSSHAHMYSGSPSLPIVDNAYGGHSSEPGSDPIPQLNLASARMARPMVEPYESSVPF